jgi:glycerophosphoryl diester phosphodiesterase
MKKKRTLLTIILILGIEIVTMLIRAEPSRSAPAHSYYSGNLHYPLVIAHQGGDGLWPGNTMYAFQQAVDLGVDAIEVDVRVSEDGVLVLMHDERVNHTTDGSGLIEDLSLDELKELDAGYLWPKESGKSFPFRGQKITVPTLEEAFQAFPHTRFVLDIKWTETPIERPICDLIRAYKMENKVVVASVHDGVIHRLREICPELASAAAFGEVAAFVFPQKAHLEGWFSSAYESLQGPYDPLGLYDNFVITAAYVRDAHARNVKVEPWTDDPKVMKYYIDLDVDGIITGYPDVLLGLLGRDPSSLPTTP